MESITEPLNGRSTINIQMAPTVKSLDQVVVIGYGMYHAGAPGKVIGVYQFGC